MKHLKRTLVIAAAAVFVLAGFYGCAKKQLNTKGGEIKSQQPLETAKNNTAENAQAKNTPEAPPGPKEQPEPAESAKAEKALNDVHFDFDKFDITPVNGSILESDAKWMKSNSSRVVVIEGNCDERGTVEYNLALGEKRAEAARNYLVSLGVKDALLKTISYGKNKPVDTGHTEDAWAKNRRDHFVVQ